MRENRLQANAGIGIRMKQTSKSDQNETYLTCQSQDTADQNPPKRAAAALALSDAAATRAAWVEIDLLAAQQNLRLVRRQVGAERKIIAVVKADAYGHGAPAISRALLAAGADMLAVATVGELAALRAAGIDAPVLILGFVPTQGYGAALRYGAILTIYSLAQAMALDAVAEQLGLQAAVQIKVDTGMHRLGFPPSAEAVRDVVKIAALPHLRLAGAFSHFAVSDILDKRYSVMQLGLFQRFIDRCAEKGIDFPLRHIANSAAICSFPDSWCNAVRPGIILYGCDPSPEVRCLPGMQAVMTVHAQVVRLHTIPAGAYVSYGCTWQAGQPSRIATLPLGYADGLPRLLSNNGCAVFAGGRAPLVGRICMDQCMADVSALPEIREGDIATLLGDGIRADDIADQAQTVNYEITCRFGARLPKLYHGDATITMAKPTENAT